MTEHTHEPRGRLCYYIDPTQDPTTHGGFVPSAVWEKESGHNPLVGSDDFAQPWIWGETLADAEGVADKLNREHGLSPKDVAQIISRSMLLARIN